MYLYDRVALKEAAKRDLKPCYWMAVLVCLIYSAITTGLNLTASIQELASGGASIGLQSSSTLVTLVLAGTMNYGLYATFTDVVRGKGMKLETLFEGFKRFASTLALGLLTFLYTFLWSLLLFIPGIIKTYAYSMAPFIQRDNPNMTPSECLQASMRLTNGHKGKIFMLQLSFFGWIMLSLLTIGIGFIFLQPYMNMSMARMYDFLILNYNEENNMMKEEEKPAIEEIKPAIDEMKTMENPFEN